MTRIKQGPALADRAAPPQRGFTLVELMISLVIFSVAVAGILAVAVSLTQGFREQRQAINAQDAVRSPVDLIADALRQASPGVQDPTKVYDSWACATVGAVAATGAIRVTNSTTGSDTLDVVYGAGGVVTTATADINTASAGTVAVMDGSGLAANDFVLLTQDFAEGWVVKLSAATANSITWIAAGASCFQKSFNVTTGGTVTVIRVQHASFYVANDASNNNMPTLWMDPDAGGAAEAEPLAEGIEDMQVVVGVDDVTVDGALTDASSATDEWRGNHAGDVAFDATAGSAAPSAAPTIQARAVRVTLIARTTAIEHGNLNSYTKPTSEDRTGASANDQYRRRVLKTVVDIRNASGSPGT